jgi:hypothetical protein
MHGGDRITAISEETMRQKGSGAVLDEDNVLAYSARKVIGSTQFSCLHGFDGSGKFHSDESILASATAHNRASFVTQWARPSHPEAKEMDHAIWHTLRDAATV